MLVRTDWPAVPAVITPPSHERPTLQIVKLNPSRPAEPVASPITKTADLHGGICARTSAPVSTTDLNPFAAATNLLALTIR
jgi:hypothetical protein